MTESAETIKTALNRAELESLRDWAQHIDSREEITQMRNLALLVFDLMARVEFLERDQ